MRPKPGSYPEYFEKYIPLISENDLLKALNENWADLNRVLAEAPAAKHDFAYAPGKWTLKQVVLHMIDTERVISYRALRFARKDPQQPLPFDENQYVAATDLSNRSLKDLLEEYQTVRFATTALFKTFSDTTLALSGNTSYGKTTVLALGYLIAGHSLHHLNVIKQRYL